jgi:LytR cell envelope-related transcriptional attenuator
VIGLPVTDRGSGIVVPDQEAVEALVAERFGGEASPAGKVRLVLLNGNGIPGIRAEVARVLVPEGFRVVESGNARSFDMPHTLIIASSDEVLPQARKARLLMGVGRLLMGEQPTGLADVTIVIGEDFGGA